MPNIVELHKGANGITVRDVRVVRGCAPKHPLEFDAYRVGLWSSAGTQLDQRHLPDPRS